MGGLDQSFLSRTIIQASSSERNALSIQRASFQNHVFNIKNTIHGMTKKMPLSKYFFKTKFMIDHTLENSRFGRIFGFEFGIFEFCSIQQWILQWIPPLAGRVSERELWGTQRVATRKGPPMGSGMQVSLLNWKGTNRCSKYLHLPPSPPSPCPADAFHQPIPTRSWRHHMRQPPWLGVDGWKVGLKGQKEDN